MEIKNIFSILWYVISAAASVKVYTSEYELYVQSSGKTWSEAKSECENSGSLLKIDSDSKTNAIKSSFVGTKECWIGAYQKRNDERWWWVDGLEVENANWRTGEPNNGYFGIIPLHGSEDCATIVTSTSKWNDKNCNSKLCFICQTALKTEYVMGSHRLTFHRKESERKSFEEAKKACLSTNKRLVADFEKIISKNIINQIKFRNTAYYTGAKYLNNSWIWASGRKVTYFDWATEQPTSTNENSCIVLTTIGWMVADCKMPRNFICQTVAAHDVKLSTQSLSMDIEQKAEVRCKSEGYPPPAIEWLQRDVLVSESNEKPIYQSSQNDSGILYIINPGIEHEGMYTCLALNNAEFSGQTSLANATFQLLVPSRPTVIDSHSENCSSKIEIRWVSNKRAIGIPHRISYNSESGIITGEAITLENLTSWKRYAVSIYPCPNSGCKTEYNSTIIVETNGKPEQPFNASMVSHKQNCTIEWWWPKRPAIQHIKAFKIHVRDFPAQSKDRSNELGKNLITTDKSNNKYTLRGRPNRAILMGIQTQTQTCESEIKWLTECYTEVSVPETVPTPRIESTSSNGETRTLALDLPNQANGLLSCIFIIVRSANISADGFTIDDLKKANQSSGDYETITYIAISIVVPRITSNQISIGLGDGRSTKCDPYKAPFNNLEKQWSQSTDFVGRNTKLDPNKNYSIFSVAAIPLNGKILLKSSEVLELDVKKKNNETGDQSAVMLQTVGALLFLLVIVMLFAAVLFRKRCQQRHETRMKYEPQPEASDAVVRSNRNSIYESIDRNHMLLAEEVIYQNQGVNIQTNKRTQTDIPMMLFETTYNEMLRDLGQVFSDQFRTLQQMAKQLSLSTSFASKDNLKKKNRYKNIIPFDENRVVIELSDTGYINASFIDGFERKKKFVATQGPLKNTVGDFWAMIMEQNCSSIVMLAQCVEAGKAKCQKYWPELGKITNYGKITIKNVAETKSCGFVCRKLRVSSELHQVESLEVFQYHFLKWPDHGFPVTSSYIIRMHKEVMKSQDKGASKTPIVVHCSAGAGRTGTFIGYDILLNEVKSIGNADVYQCVTKMRSQRPEMVQTCDQYILLHKLLLENQIFGDTDLPRENVPEKFSSSDYKSTIMKKQFENLSRIRPMDLSKKSGKISAYDRMKVRHHDSDGSEIDNELDATFVEAYEEGSTVILSKSPSKDSLDSFWKLVLEQNVSIIIWISEEKSETTEYWKDTNTVGSTYAIELEKEKILKNLKIHRLRFTGQETRLITHIHINIRKNEEEQQTISKIVDGVNQLQKEMRECHGITLVHCKDGNGMSGVFGAVMNLLERLKVEDRVDVFRTVKDLRDCKEGCVKRLHHYELCHQAILDYLRNFDTYSNFK